MAFLSFEDPRDIHLVIGQSVDVGELLWKQPQDTEVIYTPLFKPVEEGEAEFTDFRIHVDRSIGTVSTSFADYVPQVANFLLLAEESDGQEKAVIRIHIHNAVERILLAPNPLTVPRYSETYRFSVWAQFDDGIYADITPPENGYDNIPSPELRIASWLYTVFPFYYIDWETPEALDLLNSSLRGQITPTATHTSDSYDIKATLTISGIVDNPARPMEATAEIRIGDGMAEIATGTIDEPGIGPVLVSGDYENAGSNRTDDVINVLFMADGFQNGQESAFNRITEQLVSGLTSSNMMTPFNDLGGQINFWRAFVPSRQSGTTHFCEFYLKEGEHGQTIHKVPLAEEHQSEDVSEWRLEHLIWHVGLPTIRHKNLNSAAIKEFWSESTNLSEDQLRDISGQLIDRWKEMGTRRPLFDRDTFLGRSVQDHPTARPQKNFNRISLRFDRCHEEVLSPFLMNITDDERRHFGQHFESGFYDGRIPGKDYRRLVVITPALGASLGNTEISLPTLSTFRPFQFPGNEESFLEGAEIDWPQTAFQYRQEQLAQFAHGMGQTLGLGVEHGAPPPVPDYCGLFDGDGYVRHWDYTRFEFTPPDDDDGSEPDIDTDWFGNLMYKGDLAEGADLREGYRWNENNIKWRYHRIDKCALLADRPERDGTDRLICVLQSDPNSDFDRTDRVYLRRRKYFFPVHDIMRRPEYRPVMLGPMEVSDIDDTLNRVTLTGLSELPEELIDAVTADLEERPSVILLYKPKFNRDDDQAAELLSNGVRRHLFDHPYAINSIRMSNDFYYQIVDCNAQQNTDNLPDDLVPSCSKRKPEIVAFYSGGDGYHANICHPTARCMMRQPVIRHRVEGHQMELKEFCAVCRYVIVDMVDPTKHPKLDRIYRRRKISPDEPDND